MDVTCFISSVLVARHPRSQQKTGALIVSGMHATLTLFYPTHLKSVCNPAQGFTRFYPQLKSTHNYKQPPPTRSSILQHNSIPTYTLLHQLSLSCTLTQQSCLSNAQQLDLHSTLDLHFSSLKPKRCYARGSLVPISGRDRRQVGLQPVCGVVSESEVASE